jgi:hypothetical protein
MASLKSKYQLFFVSILIHTKNTFVVRNAKKSFAFNTYLSTAAVSSGKGNTAKKKKNTGNPKIFTWLRFWRICIHFLL